jgi:acetylornithine aminotransferase
MRRFRQPAPLVIEESSERALYAFGNFDQKICPWWHPIHLESSMNSLQSFLAVAPVVKPAAAAMLPSSRRARVSACLATPVPAPTAARTGELSAASRAVMEDEARYMVGTYKRGARVVFVAGRGCKLYDIDNREYLDMAAGIAVNALGHCDPDLVEAATDQSKRLGHASNVGYTVPQVRLLLLKLT